MASTLSLILDDSSTAFTYGPQNWTVNGHPLWTVNGHPLWYDGTLTYAEFATPLIPGSLEVSFEGTSIAFSGNTPSASQLQSINVSIDGGTPYTTYYMDPTPQTHLQWYQSPTLSSGKHTIKIDGMDGTALDYATITVGQDTPLSGKKVIVDNEDPSVHYSGSWTRNTDRYITLGGDINALPYQNSTHWSTTPGDTITFRFTGTSLSVYGIFLWGNLGTLAATYTIDGGTPVPGSYVVTTTSTNYVNGALVNLNFPFTVLNNLSPGDHTLIINVTQCLNHTFIFDYITYSPSFANLASMPSLVYTSPASASTSTSASSSGTASPTASHIPQQSAGSHVTPLGIVIGGVVGGSLALSFIISILFWLRRRKLKKISVLPDAFQTGKPAENSNTSSSSQLEGPRTTVSPLRVIGSPAPAHLGLSTAADLKRDRNFNISGTNSGLPSVPSGTRNPGDVAAWRPTNLTSVALPAINPPSEAPAIDSSSERELSRGPPAYEAI